MASPAQLRVTGSPQFHDSATTANIMWAVTACLVPAAAWGVYVFGLSALVVLLVSVASCVVFELLLAKIFNRFTIGDGSAVLTGLLIGMNMPPALPLYIPVAASAFAIGVVKWTFGGLGGNWMNPALAGRAFVFFSWTGDMTRWQLPRTLPAVDAIGSATPLGFVKTSLAGGSEAAAGPIDLMRGAGYPVSVTDSAVTEWLNGNLLNPLGIEMPTGYIDPFLGNIPGCIGEVSAALLLLGSIYLIAKRIVPWEIPTAYFVSFGLLVWVFGGTRFGLGPFQGDVLFHMFTGGFMLGAFYMATDMVTTPFTTRGMLIFGVGVGLLTFLIRFFGSFPEGVSLAVLLMNIFVPIINRYTKPKRFGQTAAAKEAS